MATQIEINSIIKPYLKDGLRSPVYDASIDVNNHLSFHIKGYKPVRGKITNPYFDILITQRRPNESELIKEYRQKIYLAKTKQPCFKVLNSLKKIVKSQDWKIDYSKAENPKIVSDETLEQYCEKNYPIFKSIENWIYSYALKEITTDPNGLIYVDAKNWDIIDGYKYEPIIKIANSKDIYLFKEGEVALFKSEMTNRVLIEGTYYELPVFIYMDKTTIAYIKEINLDHTISIEIKKNDCLQLNCFKAGGVYLDIINNEVIYGSFIDPMLPSLDAAARESSDLDAEVVQHIYSTLWYYSGNDCKTCKGSGQVISEGKNVVCSKCEGNGRLLKSPYKDMVIGKEGLGEAGIPTPPAGYIQKPTEIVKLQDERIAKHIFDALGSLNMEFLAQTPLNQSGQAKEVDRDELNNYVYGVAYHIVENVMLPCYRLISDIRYDKLISNKELRDKMLPTINIPEKFDLLSTNALINNFAKTKEAKIDNSIIDEYEVDIINKLFNNQPEVRDKLLLIKELDPLKGIDEDQKSLLYSNKIISKEDYVISTYIGNFIDKLLESNENFASLNIEEQETALRELSKTKIIDEVENMKNDLLNEDE